MSNLTMATETRQSALENALSRSKEWAARHYRKALITAVAIPVSAAAAYIAASNIDEPRVPVPSEIGSQLNGSSLRKAASIPGYNQNDWRLKDKGEETCGAVAATNALVGMGAQNSEKVTFSSLRGLAEKLKTRENKGVYRDEYFQGVSKYLNENSIPAVAQLLKNPSKEKLNQNLGGSAMVLLMLDRYVSSQGKYRRIENHGHIITLIAQLPQKGEISYIAHDPKEGYKVVSVEPLGNQWKVSGIFPRKQIAVISDAIQLAPYVRHQK